MLESILFDDHDKAAADAARPSLVAKAKRSEVPSARPATAAPTMACRFTASAPDLATVTRNVIAVDGAPEASFVLYPQHTPVQDRAFQLLDLGVKV